MRGHRIQEVLPPSPRTLQRDLACLLASYARTIPSPDDDPEEGNDCPLRELGLLSFYKTSGYYEAHQGRKEIPGELFGYALSKAFRDAADGEGATEVQRPWPVRQLHPKGAWRPAAGGRAP